MIQVPGTKNRLIFGVGLTHLAEHRGLFFLEVKVVDIFQWTVLKILQQMAYVAHSPPQKVLSFIKTKLFSDNIYNHIPCRASFVKL